MTFRKTPKTRLQVMIPDPLLQEIRRRAFVQRRPENAVVSELICLGYGFDPAGFGLDAEDVRTHKLDRAPAEAEA